MPDYVASRGVMEKNGMGYVGMVGLYGMDLVSYGKTTAESDAERANGGNRS